MSFQGLRFGRGEKFGCEWAGWEGETGKRSRTDLVKGGEFRRVPTTDLAVGAFGVS